jgi:PA domain/Secretion system C-terminal sorting domain
MKKLLLSLIILTTSALSSAQVIFGITSNLCDTTTEHYYNYEYAGNLFGGSTDWNTPNMLLDSNSIQGCLVMVNDGSTGTSVIGTPSFTVNSSALACDSTTWTQDLTGKIAVLYRGGCEFGLKAFNAQKRGAIGVIIINHTGDAIGMSGGIFGVNVTIPVWMIGETDGNQLAACLDTVCTGVTGYFGIEFSAFADNISSSKSLMLMTESSAMPWDLARTGTEYPIDFGIWVYNSGWDAQNGVTVTVEVERSGVVEFTNTSAALNFNAPDTTFIDSQYVDLGTYAPANWTIGTYTITYTINNAGDENLANNVFSYEFKLTNNEDVYAKCRLDENNKPIHNTAYSLSNTICGNEFESCIHFKNEFAGDRSTIATGINFSCEPVGTTMTNELIEIKAYQWDDSFTDINSPATYDSLTLLESATYTYTDNSENGINIFLPFNNSISLQNNQRYLFCVSNTSDSLRVGYDAYNVYYHPEGFNYTTTINHYLQPISPVSDVSCGPKEWWTAGFGNDAIPAISVTMDIATGIDDVVNEEMAMPYPNPTTNYLTVPVRKNAKGNVNIDLVDLLGKVVLSENQILNNESLKINVSSIANGNYITQLRFNDGTIDNFKISINR